MEINVLGMTLNCLSHPFPAPALIKECLLVSVLGLMCACDADAPATSVLGQEVCSEQRCRSLCCYVRARVVREFPNCKIYLEEKEVIKIATVNKLSFVDARKEYRRRTAQLPKKDVSYAKAAASTTRDTPSCSHCSSLEAMVEALTQQMANFISLLSANFNPIPQVQQKLLPAKTSDDPRLQSTRAKFLKTTNEKTNVSEKLKPQQQTPAKRKALNDKLKQSIKSKIDNRSQGSPKTSTHSRFSSQSSVMEEDEIVDEQTLETEFKTVT
ncbi:hypothetical protein J6590_096815, partial [Homalodisca vitripennis]